MRDKEAEKVCKNLMEHPDVVRAAKGYRMRNGQRTNEVCIVVGVRKKKPSAQLSGARIIARRIDDWETDVQEVGILEAPPPIRAAGPLSLTAPKRPCPPGYSIGHPKITAGTLGYYVMRGSGNEHYILSNNHVMANSNDASIGDYIYQPGPYDGGELVNRMAQLTEFVEINFGGGKKPKKEKVAKYFWKAWQVPMYAWASVAHGAAWMLGCPYRINMRVGRRQISQSDPNLIDGAVSKMLKEEDVLLDIAGPELGELKGIRDVQLGENVFKTGRTTEYTPGTVDAVDSMASVSYGGSKVATFADQFEVRGLDGKEFSAGGDSGSVIVSEDDYLVGLLFAGSSGSDAVTICNRISNVVSLLGIRI